MPQPCRPKYVNQQHHQQEENQVVKSSPTNLLLYRITPERTTNTALRGTVASRIPEIVLLVISPHTRHEPCALIKKMLLTGKSVQSALKEPTCFIPTLAKYLHNPKIDPSH